MPQPLYDELCQRAKAACKAYYENDSPIMSDQEYDGLVRQIEDMEREDPSLRKPDSPSVTVGGRATEGFAKVPHHRKVLSLKNAYNQKDVDTFCEAVENLSVRDVWYSVQPKYDGLTLMVKYVNGKYIQAVTRGNGLVGEDVTENARHIIGLPDEIKCDHAWFKGSTIWARGEVLMYKVDFESLNKRLEANGLPRMANERNAAAGSLRQKDPQVTWNRRLHIVFYDLLIDTADGTTVEFNDEYTMIQRLHELGLPSVFSNAFHCHHQRSSVAISSSIPASIDCIPLSEAKNVLAGLNMAVSWFWVKRDELPFKIDGAVIKVESKELQAKLGRAEKYPKWAIAYKFEAPVYETSLRDVTWEVGRTGRLTPVAHFDPVFIDGTKVMFATLNNPDYIAGLGGLHYGDTITVFKAAEIIPQVGSVQESRPDAEEFKVPTKCPVCGSTLVRDGANLKCPQWLCKGKLSAMLTYFCSKPCMDINGLGETLIQAMVERNVAWTIPDLYRLKAEDLMKLPRVSEQVANKLLKAITSSKQMPFDRVLCALGYRNVGTVASRRLVERFQSYANLKMAGIEQLATVPGIGMNKAKEIWEDINNLENDNIVQQLMDAGLKFECDKPAEQQDATLQNKGFCFTGKLSHPRDWYRTFVSSHGGLFKEAVTGSLDYLVAGEGGGSKRSKAVALNIPIITEEQLMEMANGSGSPGA